MPRGGRSHPVKTSSVRIGCGGAPFADVRVSPRPRMIQKLVAFALRMPFVIWMGALAILVGGILSYLALDIEAYPNPVPPLVEVITQPDGASPEEVERYVTIPLEIGLSGMPGLDHVRSQSLFGLSDVKCYFRWGIDYNDARQ